MDKTRSITRWRGRHPYQVYLVHGGRKSSAKTMMRPDVTMTRLLEHHVSPRMTNWNIPICDISGNTLVLSLPHTGYSELKFKILQCKKKCSMVVEINGFFIIKKKIMALLGSWKFMKWLSKRLQNLPYTIFSCQHRAGHSLGKILK